MIRKIKNWFTGEDDPHWTTSEHWRDVSIRKLHRQSCLYDLPLLFLSTTMIYILLRLAVG